MTGTAATMLSTHPRPASTDPALLALCIDACLECSQACTACADACLAEDMVAELTACIRTNLDCADVCTATGRVLSRQTDPDAALVRSVLEACVEACRSGGETCRSHAEMHQHCRICADACQRCLDACQQMLSVLG